MCDKVGELLRESEGILLRLTEHSEIDQIGDESIRTADALHISCSEQNHISCKPKQAHFDLEDMYIRYTTPLRKDNPVYCELAS